MKKEKYSDGQTAEWTATQALHWLESVISEGIASDMHAAPAAADHLFGRPTAFRPGNDLSFATGLAANGLRTASLLTARSLLEKIALLPDIARRHLPAILHLLVHSGQERPHVSSAGHRAYLAAANSGWFQFFGADAQEAVDLAVIAHRVAERALLPGINALDADSASRTLKLPDRKTLQQFLGSPDDFLESPTPAQRLLFGRTRRRLPNWFNPDFPIQYGGSKPERALADEAGAQAVYFHQHLAEIMEEAFAEYAVLTGRAYAPATLYPEGRVDYVVVVQGAATTRVRAAVDHLRRERKAKVGCLQLRVLRPLPSEGLAEMLSGKKAVTVLESLPAGQDASLEKEIRSAIAGLGKRAPEIYGGIYGPALSEAEAVRTFENMLRGGDSKKRFYLGVDFSRPQSAFPRHEVLLQAIRREYPGIEELTLATEKTEPPVRKHLSSTGPSPLIRRYQDQGPYYARLTRFFHDTAAFYQAGAEGELVADPFQALPVIPAATAGLASPVSEAKPLPGFIAENCTGCGQCLVYCPHAALPSVAIGLEDLLRGAMDLSAQHGRPVTQLTPLVRNLARMGAKQIRNSAAAIRQAGDFLPAAFESLLGQLKPAAEKEASLREDFSAVLSAIAEFPVAVTETFFNQPENREKGTGELFSLTVDPYACTGCGLCAEVCAPEALRMEERTEDNLQRAVAGFNRWLELPDTSSRTITRLIHEPEYDALAALLLSRNFYHAMTGGSPTEEKAPAKTLVHLLTAFAESVLQPRRSARLREIDELTAALAEHIHDKLSNALPSDDFSALLSNLEDRSAGKLPVEEVIGRMGEGGQRALLDTVDLKRKAALLEDLRELRRILAEGYSGGGRSRFSLAIFADDWPWADTFPANPFTVPVWLSADRFSAEVVQGLFRGNLRHELDHLKLLRRARLEVKDQYHSEQHDREVAGLSWSDLDQKEREAISPLLVLGDQRLLAEANAGELTGLLAGDWPVKIFIINDGAFTPGENAAAAFARQQGLLLTTMGLRRASVHQSGLAVPAHLFAGLRDGLTPTRPGLFHLLAPNHLRHLGDPTDWRSLSALALNSRAFPLLAFDPEAPGVRLSGGLSLEGNPLPEAIWASSFFEKENGKAETLPLTFADWLYSLKNWQSEFSAFDPEKGAAVSISEYLELEVGAHAGKVPVIQAKTQEGAQELLAVSEAVINATLAASRYWNTWRELAGITTMLPEQLREQIEGAVAAGHEAELAGLRAKYEDQLNRQEAEFKAAVKTQLREKLLVLAQRGRDSLANEKTN